MRVTDNEITAALLEAAYDPNKSGHQHARRIMRREHFKEIYRRNPYDTNINPEAGQAVCKALMKEFGEEHFRHDRYPQKGGAPEFPVRLQDERIVSSIALSETLRNVPPISIDYVFCNREIFDKVKKWLDENRGKIIQPEREGESDGQDQEGCNNPKAN